MRSYFDQILADTIFSVTQVHKQQHHFISFKFYSVSHREFHLSIIDQLTVLITLIRKDVHTTTHLPQLYQNLPYQADPSH